MGKLRYYYGTMNSMKSATLLMKAHQFEQAGCNVFLFKPSFDSRDYGEIRSRAIQYGRDCIVFNKDVNLIDLISKQLIINKNVKTVLFFDEINFMTKEQIRQLWILSKHNNIDIFCYGLRLSYNNRLFEASEELLILADTVEEIKSMCSRCDNKATTHLRLINDIPVFEGKDKIIGDISGTERYESVCQVCYHKEYKKRGQNYEG